MRTVHPAVHELSDEPDIREIVERCREVAAATGFSWLHDLVREALTRLERKLAA